MHVFIAVACLLSGCAATPNLAYRAPQPDMDGFLKFTLPQSTILLTALPNDGIEAKAVPQDDYADALHYSLMADAKWSVWTSSTVTKWEYLEGHNIVKSLATTGESNAAKLLQVATEIIGAAAATTPGKISFQDDIIDPFTDGNGQRIAPPENQAAPCALRRNPDWGCTIAVGAPPVWAVKYDDFLKKALNGESAKVFPSSACRTATITLTPPALTPAKPAPAQPGGTRGTDSSADGRITTRTEPPAQAIKGSPAIPAPPSGGKTGALVITLELANPTAVNLTRLRQGGELQASGACRYEVSNDKAGSSFDSEAWKAAIALVTALKARNQAK